jgi:hypothetical protein
MKKYIFVRVRSFGNQLEADVARQHLEVAGIPAFVRSDDAGGMQPNFQGQLGVFVEVREKDLKKADEVLTSRGI